MQANVAALENAVGDLQGSISSVPDDATFDQALQDVQPRLPELAQAWNETWNGLDCTATGASTTG